MFSNLFHFYPLSSHFLPLFFGGKGNVLFTFNIQNHHHSIISFTSCTISWTNCNNSQIIFMQKSIISLCKTNIKRFLNLIWSLWNKGFEKSLLFCYFIEMREIRLTLTDQRPVEYYEFSIMANHIACLGLSNILKGKNVWLSWVRHFRKNRRHTVLWVFCFF